VYPNYPTFMTTVVTVPQRQIDRVTDGDTLASQYPALQFTLRASYRVV